MSDRQTSALRGKSFPNPKAPTRLILRTEREVLDRMSTTGARVKVSVPWLSFLPPHADAMPRIAMGRRIEALALADDALWQAIQTSFRIRRAQWMAGRMVEMLEASE